MQSQTLPTLSPRDFGTLIDARAAEGKLLCMGLDPTYEQIPLCVPGRFAGEEAELIEQAVAFYNFCVKIVDATHDLVAAFKPNTAFFEAAGPWGYEMLRLLIRHIHRVAPGVVVVVDAKRADIGKSNQGTVKFIFDILGADAVTVNPYFGEEALQPFLEREGKGVIILVRTSNPGGGEFQSLLVNSSQQQLKESKLDPNWGPIPLYQQVAMNIGTWKTRGRVAVVLGATAPEETRETRIILPDTLALIPGVGTQGGDLATAVTNGLTAARAGILLNAGSKALYASSGEDYPDQTREALMTMDQAVRAVAQAA